MASKLTRNYATKDELEKAGVLDADFFENTLLVLPVALPVSIDGVALVTGDTCLFGQLKRIYQIDTSGAQAVWTDLSENDLEVDQKVLIRNGLINSKNIVQEQDGIWKVANEGTNPVVPPAGEVNDGTNIGAAGVGIFDSKSGVILRFSKLFAGANMTIVKQPTGEIELSSAAGSSITKVPNAGNVPVLVEGDVLLEGATALLTADTVIKGSIYFGQKGVAQLLSGRYNLTVYGDVYGTEETTDFVNLDRIALVAAGDGLSGGNLFVGGTVHNVTLENYGQAHTGIGNGGQGGDVAVGAWLGGEIKCYGGAAADGNAGWAGEVFIRGHGSCNIVGYGGTSASNGDGGRGSDISVWGNLWGSVSTYGGNGVSGGRGYNIYGMNVVGNFNGSRVANGGTGTTGYGGGGGQMSVGGVCDAGNITQNGGDTASVDFLRTGGNGGRFTCAGHTSISGELKTSGGSNPNAGGAGYPGYIELKGGCAIAKATMVWGNGPKVTTPEPRLCLKGFCFIGLFTANDVTGGKDVHIVFGTNTTQINEGGVVHIGEFAGGIDRLYNRTSSSYTGAIINIDRKIFHGEGGTLGTGVWRYFQDTGAVV